MGLQQVTSTIELTTNKAPMIKFDMWLIPRNMLLLVVQNNIAFVPGYL